jgi:hypothetical protein
MADWPLALQLDGTGHGAVSRDPANARRTVKAVVGEELSGNKASRPVRASTRVTGTAAIRAATLAIIRAHM